MSSYGHILVPKHEISVPKIANLGCFRSKSYLKAPKAQFFFDQNDCWVEIIEGETRVENLRCGAAMVTKIVKNTLKKYKIVKQQKCTLKKLKM